MLMLLTTPGIRKRTATYRRMADFSLILTDGNHWDCQVNPQNTTRHNGVIPIKIKGHTIKGYMAYFISNQDSTKGKIPI